MANQQPTERIQQLRAQGYTNSQVIDILQGEGYDSATVFDALNKIDMPNPAPQQPTLPPPPAPDSGDQLPRDIEDTGFPNVPQSTTLSPPTPVQSQGQQQMPQMPTPQPQPTPPPSFPAPQPDPMPQMPAPQPQPMQQMPAHQDPMAMLQDSSTGVPHRTPSKDVSTEEYVEAIIDEKWNELEADIQKIVEWKSRSEQEIQGLAQQVTDLKDRFDKLHAALIGKIESYDKNILEVGAEIKAMEKVFSKVLPLFTDNVKQLNDVTEKLQRQVR